MDSQKKLGAFSALVLSFYSHAAAAFGTPTCSQMGSTYASSENNFNLECDTITIGQAIYAVYQVEDTFAACIDRCDGDVSCVGAMYQSSTGDCALVADYAATASYSGYDFAVKGSSIASNTPPSIPSNTPPSIPSNTPPSIPSNTPPSIPSNTPPSIPSNTPPSIPSNTPPSIPSNTPPSIASNTPPSVASNTPSSFGSTTASDLSSTSSTAASGTTTSSTVQTSNASASSTPARNIPFVDDYIFSGCLGSPEGYPSFTEVATDSGMTTQKCISLAAGSKYIGIYQESCYKADKLADAELVADERCNLLCPGDRTLFCGGITGGVRRLSNRAISPARLLTFYRQRVSSLSSASLTTLSHGSRTLSAPDYGITKTASASRLPASAEIVTTVTYTTIDSSNPTRLITTCVPITLVYSPCNCEHQVYPSVDMTTVACTRGPDIMTLTIPRAACETGSESYTTHPIVQYPSGWFGDHQTVAASAGYSVARTTAGLPGKSQLDTPTRPSQSSGPNQGQGPSKPPNAPGATPSVVSEASRRQLQFWITITAIVGLFFV